jgi:hypothetical protein
MSKKVKVILEVLNAAEKIRLIKLIRTISGMGLKESKDFVDAHLSYRGAVVEMLLNFTQMGMVCAEQMGVCDAPFYLREVQIVPGAQHDFSNNPMLQ